MYIRVIAVSAVVNFVLCCHFLIDFSFYTRPFRSIGDTMVEEIINPSNKPKNKTTRPRPVYLWNVLDVQKWLRRHCSDYYQLYHEKFLHHDITGRVLLRINENILLRLGIDNEQHRMDIWREIMKLLLKTNMLEIRELERRNNMNFD